MTHVDVNREIEDTLLQCNVLYPSQVKTIYLPEQMFRVYKDAIPAGYTLTFWNIPIVESKMIDSIQIEKKSLLTGIGF